MKLFDSMMNRPISSLTYDNPNFLKLHNHLFYLINTSPKKLHSQTFILNKLNTLNFLYSNPHNLMKHIKERHYKVKSKNNKIIHINLNDINDYIKEYAQQIVMCKREKSRWSFSNNNSDELFRNYDIRISECKPKLYSYFDKHSPTNIHTPINSLGFSIEEDFEIMKKKEFLNTFGIIEKINKNKYGFYTDIETFRDKTYKKAYRKGIHSIPIDQFQKQRKISRGDYGLHVIKLCIIDKIPLPFLLKGDSTMYSRLFGSNSELNKEEIGFIEMYDFLKESYKQKDMNFQLTEKGRIETEKNKISDLIFIYEMVFSSTQKKFYQIFLMALMENREDIIKFLFKKSVSDKHLYKVNNDINKFNKSNEYTYSNYIDLNSNIFWINENYLNELSLKYQFNFKERENLRKGINPSKGLFSNDSAVLSLIYSYIISNGPTFYNLCIATNKIDIFKEFEKYQECDYLSGYSNINNAMLFNLMDNKHLIENKTIIINNETVNIENINFYLSNEQYILICSYSENIENLIISNKEMDITNKLNKRFIILENRLNLKKKNQDNSLISNKNNEIRIIKNENIIPTYLEVKDWIFKRINYLKDSEEIERSFLLNRFYEKSYLINILFNELKLLFKSLEDILGHKYKIEDKKFLKDISNFINNTIAEDIEENYRLIKYKLKSIIEELIVFKDTFRGPRDIFINLFKFETYSTSYFYKNSIDEIYKKGINYFISNDKNYRFENKRKIKYFHNLSLNGRLYLSDLINIKHSNIKKIENQLQMIKFQLLFNKIKQIETEKICFLYQSDYQKTLMLFSLMNLLEEDIIKLNKLTPLHMAAWTGNVDTLIFYLNYYDVNSKDEFGYFPCDYTFLEVFNRRCYMVLKLCGGRSKYEEDKFQSIDNIKLYKKIEEYPFKYVDMLNIKKLYNKFKTIKGNYEDYMQFYFEKRLLIKEDDIISNNQIIETKKDINYISNKYSIIRNNNLFYTFCNLNLLQFIKIKDIFNKLELPNYWIKLNIQNLKLIKNEEFQFIKKIKPNFKLINEKIKNKNFSIVDLKYRFADKIDVLNKRPTEKINKNIFFLLLHLPFIDHRRWFSTKISILSQIISHAIIDRYYDIPYDLIEENIPEFSFLFIKEKSINKNNNISIDLLNLQRRIFQFNISSDPCYNISINNNIINIDKTFLKRYSSLNEHTYNLYLYDFFRDKIDNKGPAHKFSIHLTKDIDLKLKYSLFMPWVGIISTGLESSKKDNEIIKSLMDDIKNVYSFFNINSYFKKSSNFEFEKIFINCEDFLVVFDLFIDGTNLFNDLVFN